MTYYTLSCRLGAGYIEAYAPVAASTLDQAA